MRILGFTINAKREPRYASYEALTGLYQELDALKERNIELFKLIEATRVRVYQKGKEAGSDNGEESTKRATSEPRQLPAELLVPGADPELYFGRFER